MKSEILGQGLGQSNYHPTWLSEHRSGWNFLYGCEGQRTQDWDFILDPESLRPWGWGLPFLRPSALVIQRQHSGSL